MAYRKNSHEDDEVVEADSLSRDYLRDAQGVNPDDEVIEADSLSIPSYRRMMTAIYPDEGPFQTRHMVAPPLPPYGVPEQERYVQKKAGPPIGRWTSLPIPAAPQSEFLNRDLVHDIKSRSSQQIFGMPSETKICAERFPSTYRLERTNFAVKSSRYSGDDLEVLVNALKLAFGLAGIDVVEFRPNECTFKCSYQKGSLFLSFMVTVFLAPSHASEQLLDVYDEDGLILVEVQLREGDGLYFSGLFRDLVDIVYNQGSVQVVGSLKYRLCQSHAYGEGLALEPIKPPGHGPPPSGFPGGMPMEAGGYLGSSPADREAESPEELDQDMTEDVMLLSGMIREGFPNVQADAASVVAGLTATDSFRQQLSMDGASSAASALASASARLLVETPHRAARRQASVVVANLAFYPVLRAALLASDSSKGTTTTSTSFGGGGVGGVGPLHSQSQAEAFSRGLLDSLVLFAVGGVTTTTSSTQRARVGGRIGEEKAGLEEDEEEQEEEIGMRRECMRALLGMSECEQARDTEAMKSLLLMTAGPSGQGATDQVLMDQLAACQNVLQGHV